MMLLYIGKTKARVTTRIRQHFHNDSYGSSFRKSLGAVLKEQLDLTPVQRKNGWAFGEDEEKLSEWMRDHARVRFVELSERRVDPVEKELVGRFSPPLNIERNSHPFRSTLEELRDRCAEEAS